MQSTTRLQSANSNSGSNIIGYIDRILTNSQNNSILLDPQQHLSPNPTPISHSKQYSSLQPHNPQAENKINPIDQNAKGFLKSMDNFQSYNKTPQQTLNTNKTLNTNNSQSNLNDDIEKFDNKKEYNQKKPPTQYQQTQEAESLDQYHYNTSRAQPKQAPQTTFNTQTQIYIQADQPTRASIQLKQFTHSPIKEYVPNKINKRPFLAESIQMSPHRSDYAQTRDQVSTIQASTIQVIKEKYKPSNEKIQDLQTIQKSTTAIEIEQYTYRNEIKQIANNQKSPQKPQKVKEITQDFKMDQKSIKPFNDESTIDIQEKKLIKIVRDNDIPQDSKMTQKPIAPVYKSKYSDPLVLVDKDLIKENKVQYKSILMPGSNEKNIELKEKYPIVQRETQEFKMDQKSIKPFNYERTIDFQEKQLTKIVRDVDIPKDSQITQKAIAPIYKSKYSDLVVQVDKDLIKENKVQQKPLMPVSNEKYSELKEKNPTLQREGAVNAQIQQKSNVLNQKQQESKEIIPQSQRIQVINNVPQIQQKSNNLESNEKINDINSNLKTLQKFIVPSKIIDLKDKNLLAQAEKGPDNDLKTLQKPIVPTEIQRYPVPEEKNYIKNDPQTSFRSLVPTQTQKKSDSKNEKVLVQGEIDIYDDPKPTYRTIIPVQNQSLLDNRGQNQIINGERELKNDPSTKITQKITVPNTSYKQQDLKEMNQKVQDTQVKLGQILPVQDSKYLKSEETNLKVPINKDIILDLKIQNKQTTPIKSENQQDSNGKKSIEDQQTIKDTQINQRLKQFNDKSKPLQVRKIISEDSTANQSNNQSSISQTQKTQIQILMQNPFSIRNPSSPLKPNQKYPGFEVERYLGKGKFSQVYMARQSDTNFRVALKVISKQTIRQHKMENQLAWELKVQHVLQHPNIVKLYTFFQNTTEIILVLEHCGDGELYEMLKFKKDKRLQEQEAARYVKQVTAALVYLHMNDVIHRDIKPENILLSFGQAKLADFSFCIYSPFQTRQTQCGTMLYSSPELVSGQEYDKSSDMWSLGVLAYELCQGETPWEQKTKEEAILMIKQAEIICPSHFSQKIKNFIQVLTKKNPRERFNARQSLNHAWLSQEQAQPFQIDDKFLL